MSNIITSEYKRSASDIASDIVRCGTVMDKVLDSIVGQCPIRGTIQEKPININYIVGQCSICHGISERPICLKCQINAIIQRGGKLTLEDKKLLIDFKVKNPMKYKIEVPENMRKKIGNDRKMRAYETCVRKGYGND